MWSKVIRLFKKDRPSRDGLEVWKDDILEELEGIRKILRRQALFLRDSGTPYITHEKSLKKRTISDLVEKKTRFLSEKAAFSIGSIDRRIAVRPSGSMPGQKSIRLAKKAGGPSFPNAGFCALLPRYPFPPASHCGKEEGGKGEGQREDWCDRPTKLEMIRDCPRWMII